MGIAIVVPGVSYAENNLGKVTITQQIEVAAIAISGSNEISGETSQFTISYTPYDTSQRGVTWSIEEGSEYATIDQNGLLTILRGASSSNVVIKAISLHNPAIYTTKNIVVTYFKEITPIYTLQNKLFTAQSDGIINTGKTLMDNVNTQWTLFLDLSIGALPSGMAQSELVSIYGGTDAIGIGYPVYNNGGKFLRFYDGSSTRKLVSITTPDAWKCAIRRNGTSISYSLDGVSWTEAGTTQGTNTNPLSFGGIINNSIPGYYANGTVVKALLYDSVLENCSNLF